MMNEYQYILEDKTTFGARPKKHICPSCGKKRFVRYIDIMTKQYLPQRFGKCDRSDNCRYHLNPYTDGYAKEISDREREFASNSNKTLTKKPQRPYTPPILPAKENKVVFFDFDIFKHTLRPERYQQNIFIQNLLYNAPFPFEANDVSKVVELYRLGTIANGSRKGAITFPYIDVMGNVRTIQVKEFDSRNHTKKPNGQDWLHSMIAKAYRENNKLLPDWLQIYLKQDRYVSCLFGEHLISKYLDNPIMLVEAPKTAIYGTLYFGLPNTSKGNFIWLATGAKGYLTFDKVKVMQGRNIFVLPDLSKDGATFEEWKAKCEEYQSKLTRTNFKPLDFMELLATQEYKDNGSDIGDFLILQDWRPFRKINPVQKVQEVQKMQKVQGVQATSQPKDDGKESDYFYFIEDKSLYNEILDVESDTIVYFEADTDLGILEFMETAKLIMNINSEPTRNEIRDILITECGQAQSEAKIYFNTLLRNDIILKDENHIYNLNADKFETDTLTA